MYSTTMDTRLRDGTHLTGRWHFARFGFDCTLLSGSTRIGPILKPAWRDHCVLHRWHSARKPCRRYVVMTRHARSRARLTLRKSPRPSLYTFSALRRWIPVAHSSKHSLWAFESRFNLDYADIYINRNADVTRETPNSHENCGSPMYRPIQPGEPSFTLSIHCWQNVKLSVETANERLNRRSPRAVRKRQSNHWDTPSHFSSPERPYRRFERSLGTRDLVVTETGSARWMCRRGCDPAWHPGPREDSSKGDFGGDICRLPREKLPTLE